MARLATFLNLEVKDIVDVIEVDIPDRHNIYVKGEDDYDMIQVLPTQNR